MLLSLCNAVLAKHYSVQLYLLSCFLSFPQFNNVPRFLSICLPLVLFLILSMPSNVFLVHFSRSSVISIYMYSIVFPTNTTPGHLLLPPYGLISLRPAAQTPPGTALSGVPHFLNFESLSCPVNSLTMVEHIIRWRDSTRHGHGSPHCGCLFSCGVPVWTFIPHT